MLSLEINVNRGSLRRSDAKTVSALGVGGGVHVFDVVRQRGAGRRDGGDGRRQQRRVLRDRVVVVLRDNLLRGVLFCVRRAMDDDENKEREREREREREECEYFFPETPNLSFARLLPVKVADGGRISSHSASFRREERINEKRRNPPLSLSRRDAREKGEVKGVCERSRDDDPYFCHLDWSSLTGENQSREREKHHPPQTFARKARKGKESEKKKNRERTTGTESFTLFALDAETTTGVAEMENIF